MKFNTLSTMMGFLALGASVSARAISEPINHRVVPTWQVAIEPGQDPWEETILVNGTIQQVDAYMETRYPGWIAKHAKYFSSLAPAKKPPASSTDLMKVKSVECGEGNDRPLHQASMRAVRGAIDHLRFISMDRSPKWSPRPGTCGQMSCTDEGAIFWCNDRDTPWPKILDGPSDIVFAAEAILSQCTISGDTRMPMVSGKITLSGDFSFIVGRSSCGAEAQ
ncbi:hypothetical protein E4U16_002848 [Claviceps sp. LM84 group G4]|nr:hypothetical protein E4U16_002848 [Claviceps sp. LM84 group G4]KAG6076781.1 hypothetical protein E4U33_001653 [Claviceps sp. LM78 group G4]